MRLTQVICFNQKSLTESHCSAFKGVMMSHATMFAWMNFALPVNRVTRTLCFSVFYWGSGFFPHLCVAFRTSDTRIMPRETFNVDKLSQIVAKFKPTDLTVPPLSLSLILQSDFPRTNAHESIRTVVCMGSIVSETLRRKFSELFPEKNLIILYGMTECGVSGTAPDEYKESLTVGSQIFPNLSLKIVDESGEKLGVNEVGELCLKSTVKFLVKRDCDSVCLRLISDLRRVTTTIPKQLQTPSMKKDTSSLATLDTLTQQENCLSPIARRKSLSVKAIRLRSQKSRI